MFQSLLIQQTHWTPYGTYSQGLVSLTCSSPLCWQEIYIEGMGQSQHTAVLWPNWPTFFYWFIGLTTCFDPLHLGHHVYKMFIRVQVNYLTATKRGILPDDHINVLRSSSPRHREYTRAVHRFQLRFRTLTSWSFIFCVHTVYHPSAQSSVSSLYLA